MNDHLLKIALLIAGGSLGTLFRYGTSLLAARVFGSGFAWGTMIVNLSGCFLIGCAFALAERTSMLGPLPRLFFVTGFLGALTTFSSYALESIGFIEAGTSSLALVNLLVNNILGLGLVAVGMWVCRHL
ncbi:MAG: CrcB family protein [Syntrophobacteraceae bacterium]